MPNIIVFLTDDHAQWALGSSGCRDIRTPNLDRLAATGAVMANAFTTTPVCSPARASFMTGLTASQHGVHDYIDGHPEVFDRDWLRGHPTIGEILQERGYQTGLVGKWHLGNDATPQHGFENWFSLAGDFPIDATGPARYSRDGKLATIEGSKADVLTDAAVDFLEGRDADRPFFLYVSHVSTHSAWAGHPERLVSLYRGCGFEDVPQNASYPFGVQNLESRDLIDRSRPREALAQYYAAVTNIDEGVGRVLDVLDRLGLRDDTLVAYTSDHGLNCGHHGIWGKGNATLPLNMVEETIRVPLILNCPSLVRPGCRHDAFVDHLDLFTTVLDYAGIQLPAVGYAGRSYAQPLRSGQWPEDWREVQFCEYGDVRMIRTMTHKLVERLEPDETQLFDLVNDPGETLDVFGRPENLELATALSRMLAVHYSKYDQTETSGRRLGGPEHTNRTSPWVARCTVV